MFKQVVTACGRAVFGITVAIGCLLTVLSLSDLYVLFTTGGPSQPPIHPEAPTRTEALLILTYGLMMIVAAFLIRYGLRRWQVRG